MNSIANIDFEDVVVEETEDEILTLWQEHRRLFGFAHSKGLKVIVHSCGYIAPLVEGLIDAGMDLVWLFKQFGDRILFFGGIDERVLISNDKKMIDKELNMKIPAVVKGGGGYILHSDHSEPPEVNYDTVWYFIKKGREIAEEYL